MQELLEEVLGENAPDWEVLNDAVITCPCGHNIELDGECPDGCISPLREMGLI